MGKLADYLKNKIPQQTMLYRIGQRIYHYKSWIGAPWPEGIIDQYADIKKEVTFIQIGANNGLMDDPIREHVIKRNWKGVMVEPVPHLFNELKQNYRLYKDHLIFENAAISGVCGKMDFYRLRKCDDRDLPHWYEGIGSFDKEVVLSHRQYIQDFDELLVKEQVATINFETLIKRHNLKKVHVLHIDVEGCDFELLKLAPIKALGIEFIMFEHRHLSKSDYKAAVLMLKKLGFVVRPHTYHGDTIAVHKRLKLG